MSGLSTTRFRNKMRHNGDNKSLITRHFQKICLGCNNNHSTDDKWCLSCRGGIVKRGHLKNKSYRYMLEKDTDYATWLFFENSDEQFQDFRTWVNTNPTYINLIRRYQRLKALQQRNPPSIESSRPEVTPPTVLTTQEVLTNTNVPGKLQPPIERSLSEMRSLLVIPTSNNQRREISIPGGGSVLLIGKYRGKTYDWIFN